ncbi:MAG: aldo/keto reductase [Acidobacteria bacterium]|nr:aldo/keto reductase [Acidobacteriota bacterium]
MQQRTLGPGGPTVSALGLGCMGMSEFYGTADQAEARSTLRRAVELGVTFFDTADMYGVGKNERLVGETLRPVRDRVFLATKFGVVRERDGRRMGISGRPEYVRSCCDASLQRLGVDHIDLYYQHRPDPEVPVEDTVGAMAELVEKGKVRYLGLSEVTPELLRRAHAVHPITALQSEYSLWSREPEDGVLDTCAELGIGFVPYSPLGRGMLTGTLRSADDLEEGDFRRHNPRFTGDNLSHNLRLVTAVEALAAEKGCTPAQLALAWTLARGEYLVPIPGTRRVRYLEENLGALDVALSPEDLARLDAAFPRGAAAGTRY